MELSEAKEVLKNIKRCCLDDEQYQKYGFMEQYMDISDVEAIDTILKALDNSISKDEVRKKIEKINSIEWQHGIRTAGKSVKYWKMVGAENALKELLGEE